MNCEWCRTGLPDRSHRGRKARWCSPACRQAAYRARRRAATDTAARGQLVDALDEATSIVARGRAVRHRPWQAAYLHLDRAVRELLPSGASTDVTATLDRWSDVAVLRTRAKLCYVRHLEADRWVVTIRGGSRPASLGQRWGHRDISYRYTTRTGRPAKERDQLASDLVLDAAGWQRGDTAVPAALVDAAGTFAREALDSLGDHGWELDSDTVRSWLVDHGYAITT